MRQTVRIGKAWERAKLCGLAPGDVVWATARGGSHAYRLTMCDGRIIYACPDGVAELMEMVLSFKVPKNMQPRLGKYSPTPIMG